MNYTRSGGYRPLAYSVGRRVTQSSFATVLAISCALALATNVLANVNATYCHDERTGKNYLSAGGLSPSMPFPFWYAQIRTSGYTEEGVKGNISTAGFPYTFDDSNQHISGYIADNENSSANRWIQTGWHIGQISYCNGQNDARHYLEVYIEIFDDTSSSCTVGIVTSAPSNASYDARYYARVGSQYQYQIYFEVPGSNNIQDLGWGDYNSLTNQTVASGEMYAPTINGVIPDCPVLGQTTVNDWNYFGQQASKPTFAAQLQLYNNSSWSDWTSSVATTVTATAPYQFQSLSNYTQFKNGGGQE